MLVPNTEENLEKCSCMDCPTYSQCMKENGQILFCSTGKSDCRVEMKECICDGCPVDKEYHLTARLDLMERMILKKNKFYCKTGPAG